ncbi:MAG: nucleotidyltransferase family protein [Gemmatimonadaceae bacterium]
MSATQRLLCACARPADDTAVRDLIASQSWEFVDWPSLPMLLVRHGLQALAAVHLSAVRDRMPESIWLEIHTGAMAARAAALALSAELFRILEQCAEAGVDVLPYKGPLLGWEAYRDLGARPSVDLDLLIRPTDLEATAVVLDRLGYRPDYHFSPAAARWFRRVDGDYPFEQRDTAGLVELHVRAMSRRFGPNPTTAELLARRRIVMVSGRRLALPGTDDVFYLQVVHGGKHRWERLEWIAATAQLLRARGGDVSVLHHGRYPNSRAVLLGCRLARDLLGAPLDAETTARIAADRAVARLADDAVRHLFDDARPTDDGPDDTAAKLWFNYRLQPGPVARMRFFYRWVCWPSPEDWERVRFPDAMFFLYRLTRPCRLFWRYARRIPHHESRAPHA